MLAQVSGNASLYNVQTWTWKDTRIDASNTYNVSWGQRKSESLVSINSDESGVTLADGSIIVEVDYDNADCEDLFDSSRADRPGILRLYDVSNRVELWNGKVTLQWSYDPALLSA